MRYHISSTAHNNFSSSVCSGTHMQNSAFFTMRSRSLFIPSSSHSHPNHHYASASKLHVQEMARRLSGSLGRDFPILDTQNACWLLASAAESKQPALRRTCAGDSFHPHACLPCSSSHCQEMANKACTILTVLQEGGRVARRSGSAGACLA